MCGVFNSRGGQCVDSGVAESVAGAFEDDDFGLVNGVVNYGGRDLVAEEVSPASEGQVAGEDQEGVSVAG